MFKGYERTADDNKIDLTLIIFHAFKASNKCDLGKQCGPRIRPLSDRGLHCAFNAGTVSCNKC